MAKFQKESLEHLLSMCMNKKRFNNTLMHSLPKKDIRNNELLRKLFRSYKKESVYFLLILSISLDVSVLGRITYWSNF